MKIIFLKLLALVLLVSCSSNKNAVSAGPVSDILDAYIAVKNALVADDAKTAQGKAVVLNDLLKSADSKKMSTADKKAYGSVSAKLLEYSQKISGTSDIEKQRKALEQLSTNMWKLVKSSDTEKRVIYYQYCPMRKAWWLSMEAAIRNPYYGASMLTCGQISETRNK